MLEINQLTSDYIIEFVNEGWQWEGEVNTGAEYARILNIKT